MRRCVEDACSVSSRAAHLPLLVGQALRARDLAQQRRLPLLHVRRHVLQPRGDRLQRHPLQEAGGQAHQLDDLHAADTGQSVAYSQLKSHPKVVDFFPISTLPARDLMADASSMQDAARILETAH